MKKRQHKAKKTDYTINDLPKNRTALFFDIVKNNFRKILVVGVILTIFAIPYIIASIYKDEVITSFYEKYNAGSITENDLANALTINNLVFNTINSVSLGLIGLGFAGVVKIIKRLCFLDPVFFLYDMKSGIKDNGLLMFLTFFVYGIINLLSQYINNIVANGFVSAIPLGIKYAIILPTFLLFIMSLGIYNLKFFRGIYNSLLLYVKTLLKTVLACIIFVLPFLVLLIPILTVKYLVFTLVLIVIVPFFLVGFFDYCCGIFDKNINNSLYPEIYRKGLAPEIENITIDSQSNETRDTK